MIKSLFSIIFILLYQLNSYAQIYGTIKDSKGNPLPFASIYIKGTTEGTFSNEEGDYKLDLKNGESSIIYKYVGYASKEIKINNRGQKIKQNIVLENDDVILKAVVISANAEDPAYAIIRNAIKSRKSFNNKPINFKSRIYQKFKLELLDVPKKILGISIAETEEEKKEIEDMLDTNKNVLIVTETVSDFFKGEDKQWKEKIISSKISGDSKSYSNMSSLFTHINFYNNYITFGRQMISPIASNAMLFYKYKLIGTFEDNNGNLINKILVIPKRKYDAVFNGFIFISDKLWNIYGTDLTTNSKNTNIMLIDTIIIKQDFKQLTTNKKSWALISQHASLTLSTLGFKAKGYHTRNFVNYNLNQNYPEGFFDNVRIKVEKESNKRDSIYWENIRPVALSKKEIKGYHRMDSIETHTSSKAYLDSIDIKNNRLKVRDFIISYSHQNSYKNSHWLIRSPLFKLNYNPVQGFHSGTTFIYRKKNTENKKYFKFKTNIDYGFADIKILPQISIEQMLNNKSKFKYTIETGRKYVQPGEIKIMNTFINSLTSLFQGTNYLQFYKKDYAKLSMNRSFLSGVKANLSIEYAKRNSLKNNTNFMFITDHYFSPNIYENNKVIAFKNKLQFIFTLTYKPGTKYVDMPNDLNPIYSNSPWFYVQYNSAIGINKSHTSYNLIKVGMKGSFYSGLFGKTMYSTEGGKYFKRKNVDVIDDIFFPGNERYYITRSKFTNSFHLLPFYTRSFYKPYITFKLNQNLNGLLLGKIPFINRLKAHEVLTFNSLLLQNNTPYYELGIGLNKILHYVSIRYSWSFKGTSYNDNGFTFSFNFPANFNLE